MRISAQTEYTNDIQGCVIVAMLREELRGWNQGVELGESFTITPNDVMQAVFVYH